MIVKIKKPILISFSIIASFFILCIVVFIMTFGDRKEIVRIKNPKNGEKIYLIHTSWSNHDRLAIGLDKKLRGGVGFLYPEKYNSVYGDPFLYKLSDDTLYICCHPCMFVPPKINKFRTKVKLIEQEDSLLRDSKYKGIGFKIFPESLMQVFENNKILINK
jgi:hypothetical protein